MTQNARMIHVTLPPVSDPLATTEPPCVALLLSGGGARSAYQVGVLKAIARLLPGERNPFGVIVGTSAGAVSAAVLAAQAQQWRHGVAALEEVWSGFHVPQVFRADAGAMLRAGLHWMLSALSGGLLLPAPRSLFDNSPLRELLSRRIDWAALRANVEAGALQGVALCATVYSGGRHTVFFEGALELAEWRRGGRGRGAAARPPGKTKGRRATRVGRRVALDLDHLMASVAIPLLFPSVRIGPDFYGDGAMRQLAPLSPAVHLGADRILVVGVRPQGGAGIGALIGRSRPPSAGQLFGFLLDTLFSDQLEADLEQLRRMNRLALAAPQEAPGVRPIEALLLAPSIEPSVVAARHLKSLPVALRVLLR
jgi:NTE family protein